MKTLGILGGMGPFASNFFVKRVLDLSPATTDHEHFRIIVDHNPHIPSRTRAILYGEESPAPYTIDAINKLQEHGADLVALAEQPNPFAGVTRDACWPDVVAHYAALPYMDGDPLDEFVLLAEQLIRISHGPDAEAATTALDAARTLLADGQRSAAAQHAVGAYQRLYYSQGTR